MKLIVDLQQIMIMLLIPMICVTERLLNTSKEDTSITSLELTNGNHHSKSEMLNEHDGLRKRVFPDTDIPVQDITALLDKMLHEEKYDPRLRPDYDGKPVQVKVSLWVLAIDSFNVIDMDFKMDFFLRQLWLDPRLAHKSSINDTFAINNKIVDRIWLPDTYFVNSKESQLHEVTTENKLVSIRGDGLVHYNTRVTVKPSCQMDLRMFPNDVQKCYLDIESYGYSDKDIILVWETNRRNGIAFDEDFPELPQHNITEAVPITSHSNYLSGNWSGIRAAITIKRKMGYFLIHVYSPCALIVVLSWISFCIPIESTAARVTLGVTSVLTTTTILNILNKSMPKVSYVKAIDWYLICCFLFVFGVLVEYTVILYLENYLQRKQKQREIKQRVEREAKAKEKAQRPFNEEPKKHQTFARIRGKNEVRTYIDEEKRTKKRIFVRFKDYILNLKPRDIDELARIIFPLMFMNFNLVYWLIFLS